MTKKPPLPGPYDPYDRYETFSLARDLRHLQRSCTDLCDRESWLDPLADDSIDWDEAAVEVIANALDEKVLGQALAGVLVRLPALANRLDIDLAAEVAALINKQQEAQG